MFRLPIKLFVSTFLLNMSAASAFADPAETCEMQKRRAVAKYTACRYKADAKAVKKQTTADYGRCVYQLETYFGRAEVRAGDGVCRSEDDVAQVMAEVDGSIGDIYAGLGGGGYAGSCGDGLIDGRESCDGSALGGQTCWGLGFASGTLACTAGCGFDVSGCVAYPPATCGNSQIDGNESCDGSLLGGETCEGLGYTSGALACTAGCGFDVSGCMAGGGTKGVGLPATGQTTAYGAGSDGAIRAGCLQSFTDNGDGTIADHCTGLMWEKKDDSGGLHDKDFVYTWSGTSYGSFNAMDGSILLFIDTLNDVSGGGANCFAGHCDWRVPNINELQSIVDYESGPIFTNPVFHKADTCTGCADVTDESCSCSQPLSYWSGTTGAFNTIYALGVHFGGAYTTFHRKSELDGYVRAVRGGVLE